MLVFQSEQQQQEKKMTGVLQACNANANRPAVLFSPSPSLFRVRRCGSCQTARGREPKKKPKLKHYFARGSSRVDNLRAPRDTRPRIDQTCDREEAPTRLNASLGCELRKIVKRKRTTQREADTESLHLPGHVRDFCVYRLAPFCPVCARLPLQCGRAL